MKDKLDILKKCFFKKRKLIIISTVVISVISTLGYWINSQDVYDQPKSSNVYQTLIAALNTQIPATQDALTKFTTKNNNIYSALASLYLAKIYIDTNQLDKAASQLQKSLGYTQDNNLHAIINLRLARIYMQQQKIDYAIKTLNTLKDEDWLGVSANLRGDALLIQGDIKGARIAWITGINSDQNSILKEIMQMKINNIPR